MSDAATTYTFRDHFLTGDSPGLAAASGNIGLGWYSPATSGFGIQHWPGEASHPGVLLLSTSTTTAAVDASMALTGSGTTTQFIASNLQQFRAQVRTTSNIDSMSIIVGFGSEGHSAGAADDLGSHGVFFVFQSSVARWRGTTRLSGSSTSVVGSGPVVLADTWYVLEAVYDGTQWQFYVNGTSIGVLTTTIPTTQPLTPICKFRKAATGPAVIRSYQIDEYVVLYDLSALTGASIGLPDQDSGGGLTEATITETGSVVAVPGQLVESVEIASTSITRTLPAAVKDGQVVSIRDTLGKAAQYPITVLPNGSDKIDGGSSYVLNADYQTGTFQRVSGGSWVDFADGRQWPGVEVGKYLAYAAGDIRNAIARALEKNPNEKRFILPSGSYEISLLTEASGGLRNNLIFDGVDAMRCEVKRTTAGAGFVWNNPASNIVFRNITFNIVNVGTTFNSLVAFNQSSNVLVECCRFLCTFPAGQTGDGIRHQLVSGDSTQFILRHSYFYQSQAKLCSAGNVDGVEVYDNRFENCNDLGVSVVSGDIAGKTLKNIKIARNRFFGTLLGSGYIYVGSDALTTNPDALSDVEIIDNICTGTIGQLGTSSSRPAGRIGIYAVLCGVNKRIKMRGNIVATDNPAFSTPIVYGMAAYLRNGSSTSTIDLEISDNALDFRSDDTRAGIFVVSPSMTDVRVQRNVIQSGSRGIQMGGCSDTDITGNIVHGSTSTALQIDTTLNASSDLRIRANKLDAQGSFASTITFLGTHNVVRAVSEHNRLVSATGSAAVNGLTGGATLDYAHNYNSQNVGLHGSITPSQNVGNRTE